MIRKKLLGKSYFKIQLNERRLLGTAGTKKKYFNK